MNQYDITLVAISEKKVSVYTESMEEAVKMVKSMYSSTDALDFLDEDVTGISFVGREKDAGEHACEMCEFYCPTCGGCTEEEIDYIIDAVKGTVETIRSCSPVWRELQAGRREYVLK